MGSIKVNFSLQPEKPPLYINAAQVAGFGEEVFLEVGYFDPRNLDAAQMTENNDIETSVTSGLTLVMNLKVAKAIRDILGTIIDVKDGNKENTEIEPIEFGEIAVEGEE